MPRTDPIPTASGAVLLPDRPLDLVVPAGTYRLSDRLGGAQHVDRFSLDRDLVTVERYRRFVDAGGYEARRYWTDEGWSWRSEQQIERPRFFGEPEWRRFVRDTRPIVGVSWYEAQAFSSFESRRLPTEREWEAAARGPEGWLYPWGNEWEEGRVAVRGVGPRVTWPVGTFRRAAGPFGHLDLVGNVWQWTADAEDEAITVRGGSWASRPDQCRTDHFNAYRRDQRHSHLGFRTAPR